MAAVDEMHGIHIKASLVLVALTAFIRRFRGSLRMFTLQLWKFTFQLLFGCNNHSNYSIFGGSGLLCLRLCSRVTSSPENCFLIVVGTTHSPEGFLTQFAENPFASDSCRTQGVVNKFVAQMLREANWMWSRVDGTAGRAKGNLNIEFVR